MAPARFLASILTACAAFGLFVAAVGIYAVTAYAVHQRERESAIRIAVGATHAAVVRMFLREGAVVLATGVALGVLGALGVTRLIEAQLYEVAPLDPVTLVSACITLCAAALLAMWLAAHRAATKPPLPALASN